MAVVSPPSWNGGDADGVCVGMEAVILAGGRGTRLSPYTSVLPKPLMPVGEKAVLEILVEQLEDAGISDIVLCVGHLAHLIRTLFDKHAGQGVRIRYIDENAPLGTAGPLRRIEQPAQTFLVMNGDVLTSLDFRDLVRHHREADNVLTIACKGRPVQIDYGVVNIERNGRGHGRVVGWSEKPTIDLTVSMGIYVAEREALAHVPDGYFDFPDLVVSLLEHDQRVGAYTYEGLWFDIGCREDYEEAVAEWDPSSRPIERAEAQPAQDRPWLSTQLLDAGRAMWRGRERSARGSAADIR